MKLTVGQKKALIRRATDIIQTKENAEREKLLKEFKPEGQVKTDLDNYKTLLKKLSEFVKLAVKLGWENNFAGLNKYIGPADCQASATFSFNTYLDARERYDYVLNSIANRVVSNIIESKYPTEENIQDDIELLSLGSDFDVEAFLDKYRNL